MLPDLRLFLLSSRAQKSSSCGFTLLELLITIILVGILSAISIPSYLNQASKARGTEAKSTLGALNRAQQAFRVEYGTMANSITNLDAAVSSKFYDYQVTAIDANRATAMTTTQAEGLKAYSALIQRNNGAFSQIICESNNVVAIGTMSTLPPNVMSCSVDYTEIQ